MERGVAELIFFLMVGLIFFSLFPSYVLAQEEENPLCVYDPWEPPCLPNGCDNYEAGETVLMFFNTGDLIENGLLDEGELTEEQQNGISIIPVEGENVDIMLANVLPGGALPILAISAAAAEVEAFAAIASNPYTIAIIGGAVILIYVVTEVDWAGLYHSVTSTCVETADAISCAIAGTIDQAQGICTDLVIQGSLEGVSLLQNVDKIKKSLLVALGIATSTTIPSSSPGSSDNKCKACCAYICSGDGPVMDNLPDIIELITNAWPPGASSPPPFGLNDFNGMLPLIDESLKDIPPDPGLPDNVFYAMGKLKCIEECVRGHPVVTEAWQSHINPGQISSKKSPNLCSKRIGLIFDHLDSYETVPDKIINNPFGVCKSKFPFKP
jgi:hypothetical protein